MITSFYPDFVNAMYHSPLTPVHTSGRRATARRKATSKVTGKAEGEATGKARTTNASTKRGRRTCTRLPYSRGRPPHAQPGPSGGRAHRACESNGAGNGGATCEHGRGSALAASAARAGHAVPGSVQLRAKVWVKTNCHNQETVANQSRIGVANSVRPALISVSQNGSSASLVPPGGTRLLSEDHVRNGHLSSIR